MKYVIDLDPMHQVLRVTMTGTVTDYEIREIFNYLIQFADTGCPYGLIVNASGVTGNAVSTETVEEIAKEPPAVPGNRSHVAVTPRFEDYTMFHLLRLFRGEIGGVIHIVLSVDEAYAMLGVGSENFSQRLFPVQLAA